MPLRQDPACSPVSTTATPGARYFVSTVPLSGPDMDQLRKGTTVHGHGALRFWLKGQTDGGQHGTQST